MPFFTLIFYDNSEQILESETKDSMIQDFCKDDCTLFMEKVKEIRWHEGTFLFVESLVTGKITKSCTS